MKSSIFEVDLIKASISRGQHMSLGIAMEDTLTLSDIQGGDDATVLRNEGPIVESRFPNTVPNTHDEQEHIWLRQHMLGSSFGGAARPAPSCAGSGVMMLSCDRRTANPVWAYINLRTTQASCHTHVNTC